MVIKYKIAEEFLSAHQDEDEINVLFNPETASELEFKKFMTWCYMEQTNESKFLREKLLKLEAENRGLKAELTTLDKNMDAALTFKDGEIADLKKNQVEMRNDITRLIETVSKLDNYMPVVDTRLVELERYTRGFNLRFYNIPEHLSTTQKEDCRGKLNSILEGVGLTNIPIENAHRVGPFNAGNNRPRAIIARFNNRPDRRLVLNKRGALFTAHVPVFEDLCKQDLDAKGKHAEAMKTLHSAGKKTYFSRGKWYVDGREYKPRVPPTVTAGVAPTNA